MEFFKHNTHINFMAQRKGAAVLSIVLFVLSLVSFFVNGLNLGLILQEEHVQLSFLILLI